LDDIKLRESNDLMALIEELRSTWKDGRVKLYLTYKMLNFRRDHKDLFIDGAYLPLEVSGDMQEHVCAFARSRGAQWVLAIVPRLMAEIVPAGGMNVFAQAWGSAAILLPDTAPDIWRSVLTGEKFTIASGAEPRALPLRDVLAQFPVALLSSETVKAPGFRAEPAVREEVRA
jgi:(1->4)-alpha-D-glucan 1-alpha-D-glucosylmutase